MKIENEILEEERTAKEIARKSEACDKRELEVNNEKNYKEAQKEAKAEHKTIRKIEEDEYKEKRLEREEKKHTK